MCTFVDKSIIEMVEVIWNEQKKERKWGKEGNYRVKDSGRKKLHRMRVGRKKEKKKDISGDI